MRKLTKLLVVFLAAVFAFPLSACQATPITDGEEAVSLMNAAFDKLQTAENYTMRLNAIADGQTAVITFKLNGGQFTLIEEVEAEDFMMKTSMYYKLGTLYAKYMGSAVKAEAPYSSVMTLINGLLIPIEYKDLEYNKYTNTVMGGKNKFEFFTGFETVTCVLDFQWRLSKFIVSETFEGETMSAEMSVTYSAPSLSFPDDLDLYTNVGMGGIDLPDIF